MCCREQQSGGHLHECSLHSCWDTEGGEVQDEGRKEGRASGGQETPNHATRCCGACFALFYIHASMCRTVLKFSPHLRFSCSLLPRDGGSRFSVSGVNFYAHRFCMVPTELTTRGCHSLAPTVPIVMCRAFPVRVRTAANIFLWSFLELKVPIHPGRRPSADNLLGSGHGRFGCAVSNRSPRNQKTVCDLYVSFFVLTALPVWRSHEVSGRTPRLQHPEAQSLPSFEYLFSYLQTPFQGWRYCAVAQRVMLERQHVCSPSPHLHAGRSALGPLVRLTEDVKWLHILFDNSGG